MEENQQVKILIVDDRPENILSLVAILRPLKYELITANSGEEALKHVLNHEFALILLDVQMPGLNGFQVAEIIKSRESSSHIPIIFVTAISQALEHVNQGYSVGAVDYIFKPFMPDILKAKVEALIKIYHYQKRLENQRELLAEQKQALEEANNKLRETTSQLRKSEALTRMIGDTSLDAIVTTDKEGYIISVNPATEKLFGYQSEVIVGENILKLVPSLQTREPSASVIEVEALRKDNGYFSAEVQIGQAEVDDMNFFVCTIRDITQRKVMEQQLREQNNNLERIVDEQTSELILVNQNLIHSEERFRKIFESSPNLMAIQSISTGQYITVNESFLATTGYDLEEIVGKTLECLQLELPNQKKLIHEKEDLHKGFRNVRIRFSSKKGELREGLLSTEIVKIQGEKCVISVITDITERVNFEKKLARMDRLNLIGEMAAGIAHKIRNPMTTVSGFLQISKSQMKYMKKEYLDLMIEELNRANTIITEFLTLAKNKSTDKKAKTLNSVINAIFPLLETEALLSNKIIHLDLNDCPEVLLDEKEIRQLILNIALNGLEAMEPGGCLTIATYLDSEGVVLAIEDEGKGIDTNILDKIGTPFFTTKDTGTGLGLAVCYSIASRHNAEIKISSSTRGTTFYISFNQVQSVSEYRELKESFQ
ncbi:Sporulation kinase E [Halalkalibacter krulwichiae]|uniref:histidine kinase n=2 Tax=Halalkalibacter krulwichiae TaxID=199441 RepID=A0A1X9MKR5_9BACI|nr:PAS domain S-box protein [Halalkalibacter krulwichiae]ARK31262.1 Sporulation kinase E [Halalkalibacter krulwichiae]